MHVRPNTIIFSDGDDLRTWSAQDQSFVKVCADDSRLLCALQFDQRSELPEEAMDRLSNLGALVPEKQTQGVQSRLRARDFEPADRGPEEIAKRLCISQQTQLRFSAGTVYAWSPNARVERLKDRYKRYLTLTPEACSVLLCFASPSTPNEAHRGLNATSISEQDFHRNVEALRSEGILTDDPPQRRRARRGAAVMVTQPDAADLHEQVEELETPANRPDRAVWRLATNLFLVLVYGLLIVPLGLMDRLRLSTRRGRARRNESTWEPCETQGLRNKSTYQLPF